MSDHTQKTDEIDWAEFQKKYFDVLMSFGSSSSPFKNSNPKDSNPWGNAYLNNALDQWWQSIKPTSFTEHETLFEKIFEQGKHYYYLGKQFSSLIEGLSNFDNKKDITRFINKTFKEFESLFSQVDTDFSWRSFVDACEVPYAQMKNAGIADMFNFESIFGNINPEIRRFRDQFLSVPGMGHFRERQDKLQKLIKLAAIYQDNYNEYRSKMSHLNRDALELMRKEILRMSKKGEDFSSMRQIYDLWIESNEKVYGDYTHSNEYSELNGRLVNSQMAFIKLSHEVNDYILKAMNLPTTGSVNELERRHYELRKKVKALETELKHLKQRNNEKTVDQEPQVVSNYKEASVIKKKKTSKKKKATSNATKSAKKKTTARRRGRNRVKNDVIKIKF